MDDSSLQRKLRDIRVPERSEEYWNDFPARVRVQLHRHPPNAVPQNAWRPGLAWAGGFALAVALMVLGTPFQPLRAASDAITQNEHHLHRELAQLNTGLHVLMSGNHGMGYLIGEAN